MKPYGRQPPAKGNFPGKSCLCRYCAGMFGEPSAHRERRVIHAIRREDHTPPEQDEAHADTVATLDDKSR